MRSLLYDHQQNLDKRNRIVIHSKIFSNVNRNVLRCSRFCGAREVMIVNVALPPVEHYMSQLKTSDCRAWVV